MFQRRHDDLTVSIVIPCHNMGKFLSFAVESVMSQHCVADEIIILDDYSTDCTEREIKRLIERYPVRIKSKRTQSPSGTGEAFNKAIEMASKDIIVLLCADDVFIDPHVIDDIKICFKMAHIQHVSRYYYQFNNGDPSPVRAWRGQDVLELANNPSGLAFRRDFVVNNNIRMTNKMFVESANMVKGVIDNNGGWRIITYDTVGVRIHNSTSRSRDYYRKNWVSSPVLEWDALGCKSIRTDFTSLLQIKRNYRSSAVFEEASNFLQVRRENLFEPGFWFFFFVSVFTPAFMIDFVTSAYKNTLGKWTTERVYRNAP